MSRWKQISIGEFADFNPSESLQKGKIAKKIPMERLTPFERKINGYDYGEYNGGPKFRNGDVLVAKITPCLENGKTAQVDILEENEIAFGSTEFIVLRENENSINDYIFYLAKSPVFRERAISCMEGTSGRKRVNEGALKRQEIIVPNKKEQQRISSVLSALDDKIELNNKINAELEAIAKTLYDYWFVQFDFPDENGKPYKGSGGTMVYNEQLKREMPEGWEVVPINRFIKADKNGDWGKEEEEGNYALKVDCIRGTDINGLNGSDEMRCPTRFILEKNKSKVLESYDLVIEISGGSPTQSTGRLGYITDELLNRFENPLICSNFCKSVSLNNQDSFYYFIYTWKKLYDNNILFGFEGKTSGIKNLLFETFISNYKIVKPDKNIEQKFFNIVTNFEKQKQYNLKQNQTLASLRDWLLPMLMNGQVSVNKAYKIVEENLSMVAEEENNYKIPIK